MSESTTQAAPIVTPWTKKVGQDQVVGRLMEVERPDIAASKAADEVVVRKVVLLEEKINGPNSDVSTKILKPFNKHQIIADYPDAWAAFQGKVVKPSGTPLSELGMDPDDIQKLSIDGLYTVEQVASLSDATCQALGFGWRKRRQDARLLLEQRGQPVPQIQPSGEAIATSAAAAAEPAPGITPEEVQAMISTSIASATGDIVRQVVEALAPPPADPAPKAKAKRKPDEDET